MAQNLPSEADVHQSYLQQAAKTQQLRWYQFYENSEVPLTNQLDILAEDVQINSTSGTANGHAEYQAFVEKLPSRWQNSHNVTSFKAIPHEAGDISVEASIIYQNLGMAEDGSTLARNVHYTATLKPTESLLPKFSEITIKAGEPADAGTFTNQYAHNRLLSLVHYWMALVEDPARKAEPFREILASEFDINFGRDSITSFDSLAEWVAGPASSVSATRHVVHNFSYKTLESNRYELSVDLDWTGILPNDTWMTAKTRHTWTAKDNPKERFPRIEKIRVEILEPFAPVSK